MRAESTESGLPSGWLAGWLGRPGATQPVTSGRGFHRSGGRASWGRHELRTLCRQCRFLSRTGQLPDLLQHCTARECRVGNRGVSRETRQSCASIQSSSHGLPPSTRLTPSSVLTITRPLAATAKRRCRAWRGRIHNRRTSRFMRCLGNISHSRTWAIY